MKKKSSNKLKRFIIKLFLSIIYLLIIAGLIYSAYKIFEDERKIVEWKNIEKTNQYTYLEINQMSEAFAKIGNKQIHFVIEKEQTGAWHTYLIAINESDYGTYKPIIDYTYKRTETPPEPLKVYGYPVEIPDKVKALAIKNITKFVPVENEIVIDSKNFDKYLTNTYLDTTIEKIDSFNYYVLALLLIALIVFIILIYTIFEKEKPKKNNKETEEIEII